MMKERSFEEEAKATEVEAVAAGEEGKESVRIFKF
jgi:hypothetical protein